MPLSLPNNYDYTAWQDELSSRIKSACGNTWQFSPPSWSFNENMFRRLQNHEAAMSLEEHLLGHEGLGPYLSKRGGFVFLAILGIVLLVLSICTSLAFIPAVRAFFSRICCGACRAKDRPRLRRVEPKVRHGMMVSMLAGTLGGLALIVTQLVASSRTIIDTNNVACGVWMQMYGHFNGVADLSRDMTDSGMASIAWKWRGTLPLLDAMSTINDTTFPRVDNPLNVKLSAAFQNLIEDATTEQAAANTTLDGWSDLAGAWWGMAINQSHGSPTSGVSGEFLVGTANGVRYKAEQFKLELAETLTLGVETISQLLEEYTGVNSTLLSNANAATADAMSKVNQMNNIIGVLAVKWDDLGTKVIRALNALSGLVITLQVFGVVLLGSAIFLVYKLRLAMKNDVLPSRKARTFWGYAFIAASIMAGFAALYCCLSFLLVGVGNDICDLLEDGVFSRGNWEVLGSDILNPPGVLDIDVPTVLDTCVLSSGDGNVAASLQLDDSIADVASQVETAKNVILETRNTLLDRDNRMLRVLIIKTGAEDIMEFIGRTFVEGVDEAVSSTIDDNDYREGWLLDPVRGSVAPWFDSTWTEEGQSTLLCLIPATASNEQAFTTLWSYCRHNGGPALEIRPVPLNVAYAALNSMLPTLGVNVTHFCTSIGAKAGACDQAKADLFLEPSDWDDYPNFSGPNNKNITDLKAKLLNTTVGTPADPLVGYKTWRTLVSINRVERFMATRVSETNITSPVINCPMGAFDCEIGEAINATRRITKARAPGLIDIAENTFGMFDSFVDDVTIPTINGVVESAYDVVDGANCQFAGTALRSGVVYPLCRGVFPAITVTSLIQGLNAILLALVAVQLWKWFHYLDDLASLHNQSAAKYDEARVSFANMSRRREFAELYAGLPSADHSPLEERVDSPATAAGSDANQTKTPLPRNHAALAVTEPSRSFSTSSV